VYVKQLRTSSSKAYGPEARVTKNEVLQYAEEYRRYARTMPTDPYRRRWTVIADALEVLAQKM
jgi:hypothetical protein